jgi:hypothetical protein
MHRDQTGELAPVDDAVQQCEFTYKVNGYSVVRVAVSQPRNEISHN